MNDNTTGSGQVRHIWHGDVAVVIMDSPHTRNALTESMLRELAATFDSLGQGTDARGVVLTGASSTFSTGEDLRETVQLVERGGVAQLSQLFQAITRSVLKSGVPFVAALNGLAVGGAAELSLCFDRRLTGPAGGMFFPENKIGFTISNASSFLLPRLVGPTVAMALVLGAGRIPAAECLELGLVDEIVEGDLIARAVEQIHAWTSGVSTVTEHLRLLRPHPDEIERAFELEALAAHAAWEGGLMEQGISDFLRKRRQR